MSVSSSAATYCTLSSGTVFYIWNHLQWDVYVAMNDAMITEYSISITFLCAKYYFVS